MRRRALIMLAILFGLLTSGSLYVYLHQLETGRVVALRPLVVAKNSVTAFRPLSAADLYLIQVPVQGYPAGGFSDLNAVTGKVSLINIPSGQPVMNSMLSSSQLSPGLRAVAVPATLANSVAYTLKSGDRVDILATMDGQDKQPVITLIAQNIPVIDRADDASHKPQAYVLALSVKEAMMVTLTEQKGLIQLVRRDISDTQKSSVPPIDVKGVLNGE